MGSTSKRLRQSFAGNGRGSWRAVRELSRAMAGRDGQGSWQGGGQRELCVGAGDMCEGAGWR